MHSMKKARKWFNKLIIGALARRITSGNTCRTASDVAATREAKVKVEVSLRPCGLSDAALLPIDRRINQASQTDSHTRSLIGSRTIDEVE